MRPKDEADELLKSIYEDKPHKFDRADLAAIVALVAAGLTLGYLASPIAILGIDWIASWL